MLLVFTTSFHTFFPMCFNGVSPFSLSHMLHVWNTYLHLPQKSPSFVGVHILAPWFASGYGFTIAFLSLSSGKHTKNYGKPHLFFLCLPMVFQWPFQELNWRYVPSIRPKFKGISQQNMALYGTNVAPI